jgi:hypothetical protein
MRLKALLLASIICVDALAQGLIRPEPSGGVSVPIPVYPAMAERSLSLQAYLVTAGPAFTRLTPITSMHPDASGVSRVDPVQIPIPETAGAIPTFVLRVWDPAAGVSYTDAGPFFNGQSQGLTLNLGASFTPTLVIIPEPGTTALFIAGITTWTLYRRLFRR